MPRRRIPRTKTTPAVCDCGHTHRVPNEFVGTHDWWVCPPCAERKHREFTAWFAKLTNTTAA